MSKARHQSVEITFGVEPNPATHKLEPVKRHLIYDYNALAELQDVAGTYKSNVATLKALRAALWAGLLAETLDKDGNPTDRTLSLHQVGQILGEMSREEIAELEKAVMQANILSAPPEEDRPTTPPAQA